MRVKLNTIYAGPHGTANPGQVIDVPDNTAKELIAGGYASAFEQTGKAAEEPVLKAPIEKKAAETKDTDPEKLAAEKAAKAAERKGKILEAVVAILSRGGDELDRDGNPKAGAVNKASGLTVSKDEREAAIAEVREKLADEGKEPGEGGGDGSEEDEGQDGDDAE